LFLRRSLSFVVFLGLFTAVVAGCDKIPFLSDYFSSKDAQDQQAASSPSQDSAPAKKTMDPNTLARVGDWTMSINEFHDRLQGLKEVAPDFDVNDLESQQLILEELVRQQLLVQDAETRGLANKKEIADALSEFRRTLLVREVAQQLTQGIEATENEARDYYEQNKDLFVGEAQWRVREIVTFSESAAKEILIEILKGADFAEMAGTHSKSQSAAQGGDLGLVSQPKFPEMGRVLVGLDVGDISSVFKGPEGFYIIKLEEKKGGEPIAFSEIKDDIVASLTILKQQQAILEHINKLRQSTTVTTNENLLK
jgi:peptidyl-prolyl cis-trans isomerase C